MIISFRMAKLFSVLASASLISYFSFTSVTQAVPVTYSLQREVCPISFYFQDIELRTLLQLIAKNSGLNFIISDAVKGRTTLNLKNVTWRQALYIIMKANGLTARRAGNVMYISTIEQITENESKQLQSAEQLSNLAPLESTIVRLKYANAKDLAEFLKGQTGTLLTTRGQVAIDERTNSLIIRDTRKNLIELCRAIHRLDIPAKQVLIEARIVTIDTNFEQQLGVRFGVTSPEHISGTLNAANRMVQGVRPENIIPFTDRLNFNNPAVGTLNANPASIGMALAKVAGVYLDLELSAIEEEGHAQIISSPHVITSNLQKATIETGEEIPYQEATSSGATSIAFKKAVLSLEIIPQITPTNQIILHMKATEDSKGDQLTIAEGPTPGSGVLGPPIINSKEVESHVLLNNNETIVIGGIYTHDKTNRVDRIPFLGEIPVVGYFFRSTTITNRRKELLIFVTPKIINPMVPSVAVKGCATC